MISCCIWFTPYWRSGVVCWDSALVKWLKKIPTQKLMSVDAPLCCRMCMEKNPQVARTPIWTHFPSIYMDNLVIFKLFFVIEVPINPMTTAPAHLTPTSNRLCYPALSVSFLKVAFTSKLGKGKTFWDVKYKPCQWRLFYTWGGGGQWKKTITRGACLWSGLGPLEFLDSCMLPHKTRKLDTIPEFFSLSFSYTYSSCVKMLWYEYKKACLKLQATCGHVWMCIL